MKRTLTIGSIIVLSAVLAMKMAAGSPATTSSSSQPAVTQPASRTASTTRAMPASSPAVTRSSAAYIRPSAPNAAPRQPVDAAAQASAVRLTIRPISRDYYPLLSRSIFLKGRQAVYSIRESGGTGSPGPTTSTTTTAPTTSESSNPEGYLVFDGASDVDGRIVAFIENTALNTISRFEPGDAVAQGKIASVTLDSLDYVVGNHVTHVMLGQNLAGMETQVITTQPVTATTGPSGSPGGSDDIYERLRKRRLQELGGQ